MKAPRRPPPRAPVGADAERLLNSVVPVVIEREVEGTTPAAIAERAGLAEAVFHREFDEVTECVLASYWRATDEFTDRVLDAFESERPWRDSLRAAAYASARWIRDHPDIVEFGTVKLFRAGLMAQAQREGHLHLMVDLIDCARLELDDPDSIGRSAAEAAFGSIYEAVVKRQSGGEGTTSAETFVPELMYLAVRPYLGHEVAAEELSIPAPPEAEHRG